MNHIRISISTILCIVFTYVVSACTDYTDIYLSRKEILNMNPELVRVLDYFSDDQEMLQAAEFLIDNLPYHQGVVYTDLAPQNLAYELFGTGKYTQYESRDSVVSRYGYWGVKSPNYRNDVFIDPDFLIDNINWAFKVWREQPWGKNVGFKQFCEYVLPYRIGNEELFPWREKIYQQFQPIIDALPNDSNKQRPTYVATVLLDTLLRAPFHFTEELSTEVRVGPRIVDSRGGSCLDLSDMLVYIYRALGIPCGIDIMPMRGNNNAPHYMNFIEDIDGRSYYFSMFYWWHRLLECKVYDDVYGKIFRSRFSVNKEMIQQQDYPREELHPHFQYPCFEDITHLYATDKGWTLKIPRDSLLEDVEKEEMLYLCMSSCQQWIPVGFSKLDNDTIYFSDCHGETVYCIGKYNYKLKKMKMLTHPFWVEKDTCLLTWHSPHKETEDVTLLSKFGMIGEFYLERMKDGVFLASNDPNFHWADTLHKITEAPVRLCTQVSINNSKKYRYLRYVGANGSFCNVSEIEFYATDNLDRPLKGKIVGPNKGKEGTHPYTNVFDGKTDTSYDYPHSDGGWVGLELDQPATIGRIVYTPRNRDNFVRQGDTYELFVCDKGEWLSQGVQISTADSLLYPDIPKQALLLLKNHTRGVAERLFEYKNGIQVYK